MKGGSNLEQQVPKTKLSLG